MKRLSTLLFLITPFLSQAQDSGVAYSTGATNQAIMQKGGWGWDSVGVMGVIDTTRGKLYLSTGASTLRLKGRFFLDKNDSTKVWFHDGAGLRRMNGGGDVSGTVDYIPKFISSNSIGNSIIRDSLGTIIVDGDLEVIGGSTMLEHLVLPNIADTATAHMLYYNASNKHVSYGTLPNLDTLPKWSDSLASGALTTKHQEEMRDTNSLHINVDSPEYHKWVQAAIIYPVRDTTTNTNTWHLLRTGGHSPINVDSVSATNNNITIYYTATANEVKTMIVSPDEANISAQEGVYKSTDPYYTNGGFDVGGTVGFSTATFVMRKPGCFCGTLLYDSVNNTFSHQIITYAASVFATNGLPFTISYNTSTKILDIQTNKVKHIQGEPRLQIISDNNARHALLTTVHPIFTTTRVQAKFWTPAASGGGFELARLPHNAIISYNFGAADVTVNPLTERFGANSNYFIFGLMSGEYSYNH